MVNPIKLQNFSLAQLLLFIVWDYIVSDYNDSPEIIHRKLFKCALGVSIKML